MKIRSAAESDLPAIVQIYNAAIPGRMATADLKPISVESRLAWYRAHSPNSWPIWVMESEQTIVGWLSFQLFYGRAAYQHTAEISIYVAPDRQRCGIGQKLLQSAIARSPQLQIKTLMGIIFAHNQPSLTLFQKFGFQQWGYLPQVAELDGVERDVIILGLRLNAQPI
ncbi:MAG: N-acetyltransferase [Microcoleus sp. PH2017_10_PVI_O_A]|uniref:GNAT family N-acetyltransferase n=1 Tax=unclassified Microcoleus TaxID=2642155 RepID=UPI001D86D85D|nr:MULTISPECIES: GNAT family N-acetyltransferase [unclassified Microcoleus]TAE78834.1 MAG: N-acetyltransferase family protein [Oscillatoriales cyanobacterium]MCC3408649.1 N-acetyltransferase [Microcoleus sp. PH2017_10_PVI_O_A]MCC3462736.1 N-acetyltransferase [Microcoleus sp. PH2017_11_PCY_U_A]MCC3481201.1 N-acetyltransferase [Microcoleus sp. PH2017_12_PCY_D_A]MCC3531640.1 N-acetyltransferase [Microcoleus sp. PH2017_21_RUC_O_A]